MISVRSRSRRSLLLVSLALPALASACDEGSCFLFALFSVEVSLLDSDTNAAVLEEGARVTVYDGDFVEELMPLGDGRFRGVEERPGHYTIEVSSPSYESWVRADIIIRKGD